MRQQTKSNPNDADMIHHHTNKTGVGGQFIIGVPPSPQHNRNFRQLFKSLLILICFVSLTSLTWIDCFKGLGSITVISAKPCKNAIGEEGTCMFMWDCIKTEGKHLGTCSDKFLFGSCCYHNQTSNDIDSGSQKTSSATPPTQPPESTTNSTTTTTTRLPIFSEASGPVPVSSILVQQQPDQPTTSIWTSSSSFPEQHQHQEVGSKPAGQLEAAYTNRPQSANTNSNHLTSSLVLNGSTGPLDSSSVSQTSGYQHQIVQNFTQDTLHSAQSHTSNRPHFQQLHFSPSHQSIPSPSVASLGAQQHLLVAQNRPQSPFSSNHQHHHSTGVNIGSNDGSTSSHNDSPYYTGHHHVQQDPYNVNHLASGTPSSSATTSTSTTTTTTTSTTTPAPPTAGSTTIRPYVHYQQPQQSNIQQHQNLFPSISRPWSHHVSQLAHQSHQIHNQQAQTTVAPSYGGSWQNRPVTTLANTFFHTFKPFAFLNPAKYKPTPFRPPFRPLFATPNQNIRPQMVVAQSQNPTYTNQDQSTHVSPFGHNHQNSAGATNEFISRPQLANQETLLSSNLTSSDKQQYNQQNSIFEPTSNSHHNQHDLRLPIQTMITHASLNNQSTYNLVEYNANTTSGNPHIDSNPSNTNDINEVITLQNGFENSSSNNNNNDHHVVATNSQARPVANHETAASLSGSAINSVQGGQHHDPYSDSHFSPVFSSYDNSTTSHNSNNFVRPHFTPEYGQSVNKKNTTYMMSPSDIDPNKNQQMIPPLPIANNPYTQQTYDSYQHQHQEQQQQTHHGGFTSNSSISYHESQSSSTYKPQSMNNSGGNTNQAISAAITETISYQNANNVNNSAYSENRPPPVLLPPAQTGLIQTITINNHDGSQLDENHYSITMNNSPSNSSNNDPTSGPTILGPINSYQDLNSNSISLTNTIQQQQQQQQQQQHQHQHQSNNINDRYPPSTMSTLGGVDYGTSFSSSAPITVAPTIGLDVVPTTPPVPLAPVTLNSLTNHNDIPVTIPGDLSILNELITTVPTMTTTVQGDRLPSDATMSSFSSNNKPAKEVACGVTASYPQTKVVGGKNAAFGAWPWQVSVRRTSFFGFSSTHRCGGAVISNEWIATAGHCVEDLLLTQIRIRVGEYDFASLTEPYPFIERTAKKKVVHPKYNFFTYENDLALVQLDQPIQFPPHVAPICLPPDNIELLGRNATVTGWGRLNEGGMLPTILQEVRVPIVSNDKCKNMFLSAGRHEYIPDIFLCAGYEEGGRDSCQGDSGGPLQVKGDDGKWFLAGIISWGIGCAERNLPGVCTRISRFKVWIQSTMNQASLN